MEGSRLLWRLQGGSCLLLMFNLLILRCLAASERPSNSAQLEVQSLSGVVGSSSSARGADVTRDIVPDLWLPRLQGLVSGGQVDQIIKIGAQEADIAVTAEQQGQVAPSDSSHGGEASHRPKRKFRIRGKWLVPQYQGEDANKGGANWQALDKQQNTKERKAEVAELPAAFGVRMAGRKEGKGLKRRARDFHFMHGLGRRGTSQLRKWKESEVRRKPKSVEAGDAEWKVQSSKAETGSRRRLLSVQLAAASSRQSTVLRWMEKIGLLLSNAKTQVGKAWDSSRLGEWEDDLPNIGRRERTQDMNGIDGEWEGDDFLGALAWEEGAENGSSSSDSSDEDEEEEDEGKDGKDLKVL